jgi:very-short-patch-repair endonuclease
MNEDECHFFLWTPSLSVSIPVAIYQDDLWFSARSLKELLSTTRQNISIHILDLVSSGMKVEERLIRVKQREGKRTLTRRLKHYPFDVAHAVALRARNYDVLGQLVDLANEHDLVKNVYKISPKKEHDFAALLLGSLDGISEVVRQYRVDPYYLDFYLPRERMIIEYDEHHHTKPLHQKRDKAREAYIREVLDADIIRVKEGSEIAALNQVLKKVLLTRRNFQ